MYIFTSRNTHFLPHVLGLSCFGIYFGNSAVNWSLVNVRLYCCEDWICEFILLNSTLFWLSETVCCQSFVLSVAVVWKWWRKGEKKTCGGNNVQISTRLLTRGWCVMATATRTRGLWTAAWDTEVLCSEKTQKLCVHTSTSTAFRNHAIQKVFRVFKVIHIYYIHIYLSFFNLLLPSGVTSFRERYHRESSLGPLCFSPLLLSCAHFFDVGEARSRCKYTNLWLVATVMWVGRRERAVQESV